MTFVYEEKLKTLEPGTNSGALHWFVGEAVIHFVIRTHPPAASTHRSRVSVPLPMVTVWKALANHDITAGIQLMFPMVTRDWNIWFTTSNSCNVSEIKISQTAVGGSASNLVLKSLFNMTTVYTFVWSWESFASSNHYRVPISLQSSLAFQDWLLHIRRNEKITANPK